MVDKIEKYQNPFKKYSYTPLNMPEPLSEQIIKGIEQVNGLYYRLVLVVATFKKGKTSSLQDVANRLGLPLLNVNVDISRLLLDLTTRQRAIHVSIILRDIVEKHNEKTILLDNIELLCDVSLKQDPLRLLQGISRNRTIVASWNGKIESGYLSYAEPNHPEYRRYPVKDFLVVSSVEDYLHIPNKI